MPDTMQAYAPSQRRSTAWLAYGIATLVCVGAVVLAVRVQSGPPFVRSLTVRNDTPFEVAIDASGGPTDPLTPLGIVDGHATETFQSVIDEGQTWHFVLTCAGGDGGTIVRTRDDLARAGWRLRLGADVATACAEQMSGRH
jgi:hypothetical protein